MNTPTLHLTSAALLPPIDHAAGVVPRVVAMARPPRWVIDITNGRARHAYAEGPEVALMDAAIAERANPLLAQGGHAWTDYAAALDERWKVLVAAGQFAPGTWEYVQYNSPYRPDGYKGFPRMDGTGTVRLVPAECYVVCTCREHEGCHLRVLAAHLAHAGWSVTLYGVPVAPVHFVSWSAQADARAACGVSGYLWPTGGDPEGLMQGGTDAEPVWFAKSNHPDKVTCAGCLPAAGQAVERARAHAAAVAAAGGHDAWWADQQARVRALTDRRKAAQ